MAEGRVGFVCFGEVNTPAEVLHRKRVQAVALLEGRGHRLVAAPLVVDDPGYETAAAALAELGKQPLDCLVVCVAGWVPTHAVIKVIDSYRHLPMLLWGLCGWREGGRIVSTADQAGTTALRFTMQAMKYRFEFVYSVIGRPADTEAIDGFINAALAAARLRGARLGTMGYRDMLLYGTLFDGLSLRGTVGIEVEPFEMLEIERRAEDVPAEGMRAAVRDVRARFDFGAPCGDAVLERSARYALALIGKIRERGYESVTLLDVDGFKKLLGLPPALVFMIIDMVCGIPAIPENDVIGSVTQQMVRALTGQIGAYVEFYEFFEDEVLAGVPDFIPLEVTDGRPALHPSAFGLLATSVVCVSRLKTGPVTLCRLVYHEGGYHMHLLRGTARAPEPWEECGWAPPAPQLPSLLIKPEGGVAQFARKVTSQHIILTYGDNLRALQSLCVLLGIKLW